MFKITLLTPVLRKVGKGVVPFQSRGIVLLPIGIRHIEDSVLKKVILCVILAGFYVFPRDMKKGEGRHGLDTKEEYECGREVDQHFWPRLYFVSPHEILSNFVFLASSSYLLCLGKWVRTNNSPVPGSEIEMR